MTSCWLSRDPIGTKGGINLYGYVGNNPLNGVDPLGLWNIWNPLTWGLTSQPGENPLNPFDSSAEWSATRSGAVAGAEAFAGGVFGLDSAGCDKSLQWSQSIGGWTRNAELGLLATLGAFSAPGTSIFYSGGEGAAQYAASDAAESGAGSTIYDTFGGSVMNSLGVQNQTAWDAASWFYANSTGSEALATIAEGGGGAASTYARVELPTLVARGVNITNF